MIGLGRIKIIPDTVSLILWLARQGEYGDEVRVAAQRVSERTPGRTLLSDEVLVQMFNEELLEVARVRFVDMEDER